MEEEIRIKIVSPGREPLHKTVDKVSLYASDGYMEVYPGHAPMVFMLGTGICEMFQGIEGDKVAVFEGIGHLLENEMTICPDHYELPDDVDVDRAQQALRRANQRIAGKDPEVPKRNLEMGRALESKNRSMIRLRMKGISVDE